MTEGAAAAEAGAWRELRVGAAGYEWFARVWGSDDAPLVLAIHGVTSDSGTMWRLGPAIAASGRRVVAVDLPGHGRTGGWCGRHRFRETAEDVAAFVRAAALPTAGLAVLGHSWGGMVAASLASAGLVPRRLILLDPPADEAAIAAMPGDPEEQPIGSDAGSFGRAREALAAVHPDWTPGDLDAKVDALSRFDVDAVRAVLGRNRWDAGLSALSDPAAAGVDTWVIRGEPGHGGLIPDEAASRLQARLGVDRVVTLAAAPHSPHRTHFAATLAAVLTALGSTGDP